MSSITSSKEKQQREREIVMAAMPLMQAFELEIPGVGELAMAGMIIDSLDPYGYNATLDRDALDTAVNKSIARINNNLVKAGSIMTPEALRSNLPPEIQQIFDTLSAEAQQNMVDTLTVWGKVQTPYKLDMIQYCIGSTNIDFMRISGIYNITNVKGGDNASITINAPGVDLSKGLQKGVFFQITDSNGFDGVYKSNGAVYDKVANTIVSIVTLPSTAKVPATLRARVAFATQVIVKQDPKTKNMVTYITVGGDQTKILQHGDPFVVQYSNFDGTYTCDSTVYDSTSNSTDITPTNPLPLTAKYPAVVYVDLPIISVTSNTLTVKGNYASILSSGSLETRLSNFNGKYISRGATYDKDNDITTATIATLPANATAPAKLAFGCTDEVYKNAFIEYWDKYYDNYMKPPSPDNPPPNPFDNIFSDGEKQVIDGQSNLVRLGKTRLGIVMLIGLAILLAIAWYVIWHFNL